MPDLMRTCRTAAASKWTLPLFSVGAGVVVLVAAFIGRQPVSGLWGFGVMTVFGLAVLLGGRSETVRGLRGDGRDERFAMLDLQATAFAGWAVILAIIVAFLVETARGHNGEPFTWLGAIAGLAYIASVIFLRLRG